MLSQFREVLAAGEGRDWKGAQLGGDEVSHLGKGVVPGVLGSFVPGYNTVEGLLAHGLGYLSPVHVTSPDALPYLRSLSHSKQISVPVKGSGGGSGSGVDYGKVAGGGVVSGGVDYEKVAGGGG